MEDRPKYGKITLFHQLDPRLISVIPSAVAENMKSGVRENIWIITKINYQIA